MNPRRLLIVALTAANLFGACNAGIDVEGGAADELAKRGADEPGGGAAGEGGTGRTGSSAGEAAATTADGGLMPSAGFGNPGGVEGGAPENGPLMLSQAQAAEVLGSCSSASVLVGEAMVDEVTDNLARIYAMRMIDEHTTLVDEAGALLEERGLGHEPGTLSRALAAETTKLIAQLSGPRGAELDLAYIQSQVKTHRQALSIIDCVIVPAVQDAALGAFIAERARPHIAQHLMSAAAISAAFGVGIPGATTGIQSSQCDLACVPQELGGLFPEPLRAAACAQ